MTQWQLLAAITGLIAVEVLHLKWIWLEYWTCPSCRVKNLACDCRHRRWLKFL